MSLPTVLGAAAAAPAPSSDTDTAKRSLVFFDSGPDNLDVLQKKYPHLATPPMDKQFDESAGPIVKQLRAQPESVLIYGITNGSLLHRLNDKMYESWYTEGTSSSEQLAYEMTCFSSAVSKIPYEELPQEVRTFKTLAKHQNTLEAIVKHSKPFQALNLLQKVVCLRRLDSSRTFFEDLVLVAFTIRETRFTHGQAPILFMGRSPSFLRVIYDELDKFYSSSNDKSSWQSHSLSLSFSGTPDIEMLRDDALFADKEKNAVRNMVTPERLAFYMNYMDAQGMQKVDEKLYLVENFKTGGGLVAMLRVLRYYYQVYLKRPSMPDVTLLGMNILFCTGQKDKTWKRSAQTGTLTIDAKVDGMPKVQMQSHPLQVSNTVLRGIDVPVAQYYFCKEVSLPAYNWNKDYLKVIEKGGAYHTRFNEWLREQTVKTVDGYEDKAAQAAKPKFIALVKPLNLSLPKVSILDVD